MNFVTFVLVSLRDFNVIEKVFFLPFQQWAKIFLLSFFFLCVFCDITLMIVPRKDIIIIIIQHTKIDFSYLALQHLSLSLSFLITHICVGILWVAFLSPYFNLFYHSPTIHPLPSLYILISERKIDAQK